MSVSLPLSLDVPLPYQVVKGEQLVLKGSVYNRLDYNIKVPTVHRRQPDVSGFSSCSTTTSASSYSSHVVCLPVSTALC